MVEIIVCEIFDSTTYFPVFSETDKCHVLSTFLFDQIGIKSVARWKSIIKGEERLIDGIETTLELNNGILTIEIDWNESLIADYPVHFLERIFDVWVAMKSETYPFIEIQIDWEQETCVTRGLQEWVHPQKEEADKLIHDVLAKFHARSAAIDKKAKERPELANALYTAFVNGWDIDLDKL